MKIEMKTLAAGPDGVMLPGKTYEVSEKKGKDLVDGRFAVESEASAAGLSSNPAFASIGEIPKAFATLDPDRETLVDDEPPKESGESAPETTTDPVPSPDSSTAPETPADPPPAP